MKTILILCILGDPVSPPASYHRTGGFNVDTEELIKYFDSEEYSLAVITNTSQYCPEPYIRYNNYTDIYRIELSHDIMDDQERLADKFDYFWEGSLKIIQDNNLSPSFIHSMYWYSGYLGSKLSVYLNIPFIHSVVALAADKDKSKALKSFSTQLKWEKIFLPKAALILTITKSEQDTLKTYYGIPEKKCVIVGRNVSSSFSAPHDEMGISSSFNAPHDGENYLYITKHAQKTYWWNNGAFLYMGRLKCEKGVDIIVYAWYSLYKKYNGKIPPLWLIGGDPDAIKSIREQLNICTEELEALEKEYKLCWWGYLNPPAISTLLMKSLVLIMHSQYESGGRIIIEAFSLSRPVIATPTGFGKDFVRNWINGFLVPFGDVKSLMNKMEYFIKQPLLSKVLGQVAYQYHLETQNMWSSKDKHLLIYKCFADAKPVDAIKLPSGLYDTPFHSPIVPFGKISAFPYGYQEKENYEYSIKKVYRAYILALNYQESLSHQSYIWYMQKSNGRNYVVKAVFSLINIAKIWNNTSCQEAIISQQSIERFHRCKHSSCLPSCISSGGNYIIMPLASKIYFKSLSLVDLKKIALICYQFNIENKNNKENGYLKPLWLHEDNIDLYNILKEIINPFTATSEIFLCFINDNHNAIQRLLSAVRFWKTDQVLNYGNSILDHIMLWNNKIFLLPSRYVYAGPFGMDAGQLCVEYCLCKPYIKTVLFQIITLLSEVYRISQDSVKLLTQINILLLLRAKSHLGLESDSLIQLWEDIKDINTP